MGKIKVLDKHVASLIAAGEVVGRSGSVIKELVENSIDAGADSISVEIKAGGSAFMRVSDNGCGMTKEDAGLCLLRHATSKLSDEAGLEAITSLGFRGEALSSICAVSRMEILTKTKDDEAGILLRAEGGEIFSISKAGCPTGTTVIVRDLFYNTPARLKFLKRDSAEAAHISDIMSRIALGNPSIAFKLIRDGNTVMQTYGDGELKNAVYAVWGKRILDGMTDVDYEKSGIKVSGLVCAPYAAKNNRSFQNFYINGRFVRSKLLSAALSEAYSPNLFTGRFPVAVLHIEIAPSAVDVNVDPEKLTVKFSNERDLFDTVYFAVKSALSESGVKPARIGPKYTAADFGSAPIQTAFISPRAEDEKAQNAFSLRQDSVLKNAVKQGGALTLPDLSKDAPKKPDDTPDGIMTDRVYVYDPDSADIRANIRKENKTPKFGNTLKNETYPDHPIINTGEEITPDVFVVGELYSTYIIAQSGDITYIIDKHAAHERIIFERIRGRSEAASQILLSPESITLSPKDFEIVMSGKEALSNMGFDIEDFGTNTVLVRAVPFDAAEADTEQLIYELIADIERAHDRKSASATEEMLKTVACKAAIKAGYVTSKREMEELSKLVLSDSRYKYCPHGRPTYLKLTNDDLKKQFSRT
ncbi:MAG: DNA mismatch repair endonuclease MutL [Clostridia bacterium]|nr:DNA mismatch repair endonuclease MutL [Clostridia bacterium]